MENIFPLNKSYRHEKCINFAPVSWKINQISLSLYPNTACLCSVVIIHALLRKTSKILCRLFQVFFNVLEAHIVGIVGTWLLYQGIEAVGHVVEIVVHHARLSGLDKNIVKVKFRVVN